MAVTIRAQSSGTMKRFPTENIAMAAGKKKEYDLGNNGTITFHVSEDAKRLLIDFDVEEKGLTKTAINLLIDALKETRKAMVR
jgi:hypothetical protein